MASQVMKWVLSCLGVSFFAVRNFQASLLLPTEMDPKAPPEHWAEQGIGQPIPSQISISLQKTAAGVSALLSPPTTAYSIGHCSQPLKDSVAWSSETVESLPCARGVLPTCPRAISPCCTHVPDVKTSSDIKTHCSALAAWKNKITG